MLTMNKPLRVCMMGRKDGYHRAYNALDPLIERIDEEFNLMGHAVGADVIIVPGDRKEIFAKAVRHYNKHGNDGMWHLWAGDTGSGTLDEARRHSLSLMCEKQLCTASWGKNRVGDLHSSVEMKADAEIIGNLMMDSFDERSYERVPDDAFVLVLYNPPEGAGKKQVFTDLQSLTQRLQDAEYDKVIWIEPNGNKHSEMVIMAAKSVPFCEYIGSVKREAFLGLMEECEMFYTNSSCAEYEARPIRPDELFVTTIGKRNDQRKVDCVTGALKNGAIERIVDLLKQEQENG